MSRHHAASEGARRAPRKRAGDVCPLPWLWPAGEAACRRGAFPRRLHHTGPCAGPAGRQLRSHQSGGEEVCFLSCIPGCTAAPGLCVLLSNTDCAHTFSQMPVVKDKTKVSPTLQTLCGRVPPSPSLHGNHRSSSFSSPPAYNSAARDDVLSLAAQNGTELVYKKWKLFSSYELLFIKGRKRDEKKFTFTATSPANSKQCQAKETYEKQMVESRACKPPEKPQPRSSPPVLTCWAVPVSRAGFPAGPPSSGALMIRLRECSAGQALSSSPSDKEDVAFHLHIYRTLFRF